MTMAELRAGMEALAIGATASGLPMPKEIARHANALMKARLREARGLPPVAPRKTRGRKGQTVIEEG
jgi:hypothetical protein